METEAVQVLEEMREHTRRLEQARGIWCVSLRRCRFDTLTSLHSTTGCHTSIAAIASCSSSITNP